MLRINNINIEKIKLGAVVIGVGVMVEEKGIVVTHRFNVELPGYVSQEIQDVLIKHFGSVNSLLKLQADTPIGKAPKNVNHKELEGLK
jgi:hypothetical protein